MNIYMYAHIYDKHRLPGRLNSNRWSEKHCTAWSNPCCRQTSIGTQRSERSHAAASVSRTNIYIYISIYLYIYLHTSVYLCIYIYNVYVCICIYMYIYIHDNLRLPGQPCALARTSGRQSTGQLGVTHAAGKRPLAPSGASVATPQSQPPRRRMTRGGGPVESRRVPPLEYRRGHPLEYWRGLLLEYQRGHPRAYRRRPPLGCWRGLGYRRGAFLLCRGSDRPRPNPHRRGALGRTGGRPHATAS